ncbi:MAG: class I SAM-dependent methyltransferase [Lachnospiraceae bacterium]|nr:class I SAM-dependent methyltransferase [Lachnospiraceae bacterium]
MIRLSKRLSAIRDLVIPCKTAADIGCDHGFLSIRLIEEKLAEHVFAADINEGPLMRAREHILEAHLEECIDTIQCDGLSKIPYADAVVIAGMGGQLMLRILKDTPEITGAAKELILQPQSEIGMFRRELCAMGFLIDAEDFVIEDGKYYPMMRAIPGKMELTELQALYGPCLLKNRHPGLLEYLQWQREYLAGLADTLKEQESDKSSIRLAGIFAELKQNEEALRYMNE